MNDKSETAASMADIRRDGQGTPQYLVPNPGKDAVSEPAIYRSLFILDTVENYLLAPKAGPTQGGNQPSQQGGTQDGGTPSTTLVKPIDPFDDAQLASEVESKPAVGVLMVHKQTWKQSGLALGNLLQSVCLAPGEVTRIAVTDWRRRESGTSAQSKEQGEGVSSDIEQQRAVNEVQRAVANEAQSGRSSAISTSASAQAAVGISTLFATANASAAANTTSALTAQFSAGARNLAATSTNAISTRTAEKSQALRSLRQTVVREVTQEEKETMTTRILANYNRRHSLNIEYFEVLQKYSIVTELVGWARCLFVPLQPLDLSNLVTLKKHRAELVAIFNQLGDSELAKELMEAVLNIPKNEAHQKQELHNLEEDVAVLNILWGTFHAIRDDLAKINSGRHSNGQRASQDWLDKKESNVQEYKKEYNQLSERFPFPDNLLKFDTAKDNRATPDQLDKMLDGLTTLRNRRTEELTRKRTVYTIPVTEVLNAARMFLSQMIWQRMDSYRIYRALALHRIGGKALSTLVDPHPIGVFGNYLAFRWGFGRGAEGDRQAFEREYLKQDDKAASEGAEVALPTSGVFAEAVLGLGEAAEEIDQDRFGNWGDNAPPILPPEIGALASRDRYKDMSLSLGDFAALAQLRSKPLSDASHINSIVSGVTKGDTFRNMGGLDHAIELASKMATLSEKGATRAGDRNAEMQAKVLDTFVEAINSEVGKAAVAEFMLPGAGPVLLQEAAQRGTALWPSKAKTDAKKKDGAGDDGKDATAGKAGGGGAAAAPAAAAGAGDDKPVNL